MENIVSSINVVLPLFLLMTVGWFLRKKNYLEGNVIDAVDNLVYRLFLPCMLFDSIYTNRAVNGVDKRLLLYCVITLLLLFVALYFFAKCITPENPRRGALAHGIFRSNTIIFGTPLAAALLEPQQASHVLLTLGVLICLSNLLGIAYLELFRNEQVRFGKLVVSIISNPIVCSIFIALLLKELPWTLPAVVLSPVKTLGGVTSALAFLVLGATFTLQASRQNARELMVAVAMKTLVLPLLLVVVVGAFVMGFRGSQLVVLLCLFATPTAVSTYPAAKKLGADAALAGEIVVFTTASSIVTLFLLIFLLKQLALI